MKWYHVLFILLAAVLLTGCAASPNEMVGTQTGFQGVAGFWLGLWHGMIAGLAFIISLFEPSVGVYEIHNNGNWYNLGFLLGIGAFAGICTKGVTYRKVYVINRRR